VLITIPKENTRLRTKLDFACVVGAQVGATCIAKNTKKKVIWWLFEEALIRCFIINYFGGKAINKIDCSAKCFILEF
jgi:hypothetical protein